MSEACYRYELFGLKIASELALPELFPDRAGGPPDVCIRRGSVPDMGQEAAGLTVSSAGAVLKATDVGRYLMRDGREILVEADANGSERNVRLFLLGSAFAAILHQRALLPLHANAVVVEGRAVAFLGHPQAGKSTMAARFHDRGFRVLADDVCVITTAANGRPSAHPGVPRLRLWREALEASGRQAGDYEASFDNLDKYDVPTSREDGQGAVPLNHIYLLVKAEEGDTLEIARLSGVDAVDALVANTYRGSYVPLLGGARRHFLQCVALATAVPVFRAARVWGLDELEAQARLLEAHARSLISAQEG